MIEIDVPQAATTGVAQSETPYTPPAVPYGTGRRKTSVARVRLTPGSGQITVNKRPADEFFCNRVFHMRQVRLPLEVVGQADRWDVHITVRGGGLTGQAGAIRHGLARALVQASPDNHQPLHKAGLLTRDPRMVERKKYGQPGARKRFQFSKR